MTKDDVIRMAREAGATIRQGHRQGVIVYEDGGNLSPMVLGRFADLVAAAERERCSNRMATAEQQRDARTLRDAVEMVRYAADVFDGICGCGKCGLCRTAAKMRELLEKQNG